jgi:hypothetical protein
MTDSGWELIFVALAATTAFFSIWHIVAHLIG